MRSPRQNMAWYFLDSNLEAGRGGKAALRWGGGEWTYADVVRESNRLAHVLRDRGVRPGDRVLIVLPDVPAFAASFFGTLKAGGVVTMANGLLTGEELAQTLDYTGANVLITFPEAADRLPRDARPREILTLGRDLEGAVREAPAEGVDLAVSTDDPCCWLFTGGTTGLPKAVIHRHRDFVYNAERYAKQILRMTEADVTLAVPKLFFGYATGTNLLFPFAAGATTCLFPERSTAEAVFENIRRFRPTVLANVPTMVNAMVQHPAAADQDLASLRLAVTAGEALPPALYARWRETFGVELLDGIGSAEMFHIYVSQRAGEVRPGSLGRAVPGYRAEVRDEEGVPLRPGEVGRLWVRGASAGTGYAGDPARSADTFRGEWVKTADLFRQDEDGYFWYSGRADELLKVGGMFVAPVEVEGCLLRHAAVADAAVTGFTDPGGLVKPCAFVVPRPRVRADEALAAELQQFVKTSIAPYKYPRRVRFVDALPRTDRGKIDRKRLPELLT